jgi:hypothetical protein
MIINRFPLRAFGSAPLPPPASFAMQPSRAAVAHRVGWVLAVIGLVLAPRCADAQAALPPKNAHYSGRTSQGLAVSLDQFPLAGRRSVMWGVNDRTTCRSLGTLPVEMWGDLVTLDRAGHVTDVVYGASPVNKVFQIAGSPHTMIEVSRLTLTAHFTSSRKVRGTYRRQSALIDYSTFPNGPVVDTCDTGQVTWSATLHR